MTLSDYRRAVDQGQSVAYFSQVASASEYYPPVGGHGPVFGMLLTEGNYSSGSYRFGFNGMEMDDEVKGTGNSYTTLFRQYDPRLGRWFSIDPLSKNFTGYSPYHFAYCNPIKVVDTDGKENVVVVGNQGESPSSDKVPWYKRIFGGSEYRYGKNKRHFLEAGLNSAIELKRNHTENEETTTMIVYKGQYTDDEINEYKERAEKAGINFQIVNTSDQIKNYVNKNGGYVDGGKASNGRGDDLITDFVYIGHGSNKAFLVGYGKDDKSQSLKGSDLSKSAFSNNSNAWLLGCGNGLDMLDYFKNNLVGGNVFGYRTTVIWGGMD